jgi:glycosyltransferase involved in cell wall biosynthesis
MRIGVDLCDWNVEYAGGVNSFAAGLIAGLAATAESDDSLILLVTPRNSGFLREKFAGLGVAFLEVPAGRIGARIDTTLFDLSWALGNFRLRFWYDRIVRGRLMRRIDRAIDVLVAPMTLLHFYGLATPALLSIHDIQQEYHPEFFTRKQQIRRWAPYRLSVWQARTVQASSQFIMDCLLEKFAFLTADKVCVIPEGVDLAAFASAPDEKPVVDGVESGKFVFYPAQLWPHKNHRLLIDALACYRDQTGSELACVLSGSDYGSWPDITAHARDRGLRRLHYLGRVSFAQLLWLYRNCRAVLALGMHESSSLPIREGAVFGKVLIGLDIPPNRESADQLRIALVDRTDPASLAKTFVSLQDDGGLMVKASAENADLVKSLNWETIAGVYRVRLKSMLHEREV